MKQRNYEDLIMKRAMDIFVEDGNVLELQVLKLDKYEIKLKK